jgi:hypothetical protein
MFFVVYLLHVLNVAEQGVLRPAFSCNDKILPVQRIMDRYDLMTENLNGISRRVLALGLASVGVKALI